MSGTLDSEPPVRQATASRSLHRGATLLLSLAALGMAALVLFHAVVKVGVDARLLAMRAWDAVYFAAFVLAAHAVGARALRRWGPRLATEWRALAAFGVGTAAYSCVGLLLAMAQLFRAPLLVAAVLLPALVLPAETRALARDLRALARRPARIGTALLLALLVYFFLLALSPPWWIDPVAYQLVTPKEYLAHGGVSAETANILTFLPSAMNVLYGFLMAGGSDHLPKLLHFSFLLGSLGLLFQLGRRLFDLSTAGLAALLLAAQWESFQGVQWENVDFHSLFFGFFALALVLLAIEDQEGPRSRSALVVLAGLFLGTALAGKYTAVFAALGVGAATLVASARRRLRWRDPVLLGAVALVTVAPTLVRNAVFTGDPLFPLLAQRLGAYDLIGPEQLAATEQLLGLYAPTTTLRSLTMLPALAYLKADFPAINYDGFWDPFYLLSLPLGWLLVRRRPALAYVYLFLAVFLLAWASGPYVRYALPAIAATCLLTAACVESLPGQLAGESRLARRTRWTGRAAILIFAVLQLALFWKSGAVRMAAGVSTFLGLEQRREFLRATPAGEIFELNAFLQGRALPGDRLFMVFAEQSYYLDLPARADPTRTALALLRAQPDPVAWLRARGYRWLLVDEGRHHFLVAQKPVDPSFHPDPRSLRALEELWGYWRGGLAPQLTPVARFGGHTLWELPPQAPR